VANFLIALSFVLRNEGGYVDDPLDRGSATNLGITIRTLSAWYGRAATVDEVRSLTPSMVAPIYKSMYWAKIRGDAFRSQALATAVFDASVLCGPPRALRMLAIARIEVDKAEYESHYVGMSFCNAYAARVTAAARAPSQQKWLPNWLARVGRCRRLFGAV
jgi:lysozyme family protein